MEEKKGMNWSARRQIFLPFQRKRQTGPRNIQQRVLGKKKYGEKHGTESQFFEGLRGRKPLYVFYGCMLLITFISSNSLSYIAT